VNLIYKAKAVLQPDKDKEIFLGPNRGANTGLYLHRTLVRLVLYSTKGISHRGKFFPGL